MNARHLGRRRMYEQGLPCVVELYNHEVLSDERVRKDLALAAKDLGEKVTVSINKGDYTTVFTMDRKVEAPTKTKARNAEIKKWGGAGSFYAHVRQRREESATGVFMVRHFGYTSKQAHKRIDAALRPTVVFIKTIRPGISEVTVL